MRQKKRWLSFLTAAALAVGLLVSPVPARAAELGRGSGKAGFL